MSRTKTDPLPQGAVLANSFCGQLISAAEKMRRSRPKNQQSIQIVNIDCLPENGFSQDEDSNNDFIVDCFTSNKPLFRKTAS